LISAAQVAEAISDKTALVSVMLANNEIGVIQPIAEIAAVCRERGVPLHCDATQAVGKIPVDVARLGIDLMSFSAHKVYGPKGVGALYVRRQRPAVRLEPQIDGGGQEHGLRSGTLNVPGIVGFGKALEIALAELPAEMNRLAALRSRLYAGLQERLSGVSLNGPALEPIRERPGERGTVPFCSATTAAVVPATKGDSPRRFSDLPELRLPGNLNVSFAYVDGEALLLNMRDLAVSSGSACASANPEPSHVLRALGIDEDLVRASLRFGLGRFNTEEEVDFAISKVVETVNHLRVLSGLA
jgi:cysteine desulfurase